MLARVLSQFLFGIVILVVGAALFPIFAHANGAQADAKCTPVTQICGCHMKLKGNPPTCQADPNMFMCECDDSTNGGSVKGHCTAQLHCHADSFSGGGFSGQVMQSLQQLLQKLMQGGGGDSGGGAPTTPTTLPTCTMSSSIVSSDASGTIAALSWTSSPDVTTASIAPVPGVVAPNGTQQITAVTGSNYVMTVAGPGGTNTCSTIVLGSSVNVNTTLSDLLGGTDSSTDLLSALQGGLTTNTNTNTNTNAGSDLGASLQGTPVSPLQIIFASTSPIGQLGSQIGLMGSTPGASGDIFLTNSGATIYAGAQNVGNNTVVAGFYGSDTFGGQQPQGLVAQMCQSRPWASGFLSSIIAPSFFDGLCSWRGYQVGTPQVSTPVVQIQQSAPQQQTTSQNTTASTSTNSNTNSNTNSGLTSSVPPKVSIWASPASVPLATRTSIFWNTQGVTQCKETSPDGNFNQSSLSGGASTVPLTGPTTFTIACLDVNGNPVTGSVTVNLSI